MVAAQFQMTASQSKHDGIGQDDARQIEIGVVQVVVHIGSKDRLQGVSSEGFVVLQDFVEVGKVLLSVPNLIIEEVHFLGACYLLGSIAAHCIHDESLVGELGLDGPDKRSKGGQDVHLLARVTVELASVAQLVNLESIEVQVVIHFCYADFHVCSPGGQ